MSQQLNDLKEDYLEWDDYSPQRFMFVLLCKRAKDAVTEYWDLIFEIMGVNCVYTKPPNLRMDMLGLIEYFLENEDLKSTLVYYGEVFLKGVLLPCLEWRVGQPNVKIREGAIICTKKLIDRDIISEEDLYANFTPLFDTLKNCLDDDYTSSI